MKGVLLDNSLWFHLFLLLSTFTIVARSDDCVYTVYVRTGSILKAGTDSIISLGLYDEYGYMVDIPDLEAWGGIMDPGYNYFERGHLDIFSGRGPCLSGQVCAMNLTSDGSGPYHGWYNNYVEVTSTGAHIACAQTTFTVEQWLATDTSPYVLTAIRNYCPDGGVGRRDVVKSVLSSKGEASLHLYKKTGLSSLSILGRLPATVSLTSGTVRSVIFQGSCTKNFRPKLNFMCPHSPIKV